jgi:hypothetical protein
MFISSKQLQEIILSQKAQARQIKALTAQVSSLQSSIKELTEERKLLTDGEMEVLTEQLINNDEFEEAISGFINDYLGDNIGDYVTDYLDSHHYVVSNLVSEKINDIFEEVTIKIER